MNIVTLGIDLAKNIFALHGVDNNGHAILIKPRVRRDQLLSIITNLPTCLIGMEGCTEAHHWACLFRQFGKVRRHYLADETIQRAVRVACKRVGVHKHTTP